MRNRYYRINFSVPRKQMDVYDILSTVPNRSQFIIQAIREKFDKESENDEKPKVNQQPDIDISGIIQNAIGALVAQGKLTINTQPAHALEQPTLEQQTPPPRAPVEIAPPDDNKDLLMGMLSELD